MQTKGKGDMMGGKTEISITLVYDEDNLCEETEKKLKTLAAKHGLKFCYHMYDTGGGIYFSRGWLEHNIVKLGENIDNPEIEVYEKGYEKVAEEARKILMEHVQNLEKLRAKK